MKILTRILIVVVVLLVGGGAVFLASWDMPPPAEPVEKVIPHDRILR